MALYQRAFLMSLGVVLLFTGSVWGVTPVHQWSKRFGDTGDRDRGRTVAVDASGNVIAAGTFEGTVDFGGGPLVSAGSSDIYITKYDASGVHQWSKRFGDTGSDFGYSVAVDASGNVVLAGGFAGTVDFGGGPLVSAGLHDIFVTKYDANGVHQWSRRFGDSGDERGVVAMDASSNVIVTGEFWGTVDFGGGPLVSAGFQDIFIAKYDASGVHQWSQRFGDTGVDSGASVAADASGNVIVTGFFQGTVDFGGGPLMVLGSLDIFVAKYDASGVHQWSQRFGDTGVNSGASVAADASGNVILTGGFWGTVDFGGGPLVSAGNHDIFVATYYANGVHQWSQRFGDTGGDSGTSVAVDASGNIALTGNFTGTADFGGGPVVSSGSSDIFVATYDASGVHQWSRGFGDIAVDSGTSVAVDASGNVILTGYFFGTVDFGGGPLVTVGGFEAFLVKFSSAAVLAELDIKPGSCPNPFNRKLFEFAAGSTQRKGGVLPVAILGSDEFDVSDIDVSMIRLEGVEPIVGGAGFKRRDVSSSSHDSDCECTHQGPDGFDDLWVLFSSRQIAEVVGAGRRGEERLLMLTGKLLDGTPFEAADCIRLVGEGNPSSRSSDGDDPTLDQASPNPFNPVTTITYTLPRSDFVTLSVYDVSGALVQQLVSGIEEEGEHVVKWNANRFPSGIYFYRLDVGSYTETKKMILLK